MKTHHVLIIGGGSIGERHLRCFGKQTGVTVSLCELKEDVRDRLVATYGPEHVFADLQAALEESYDAAVICTPAHLHVPMGLECAERGLHLLIEKPLSTAMTGVEKLRDEVKRRGLVCGIGYTGRSERGVQSIKKSLDAGELGEIRQVTVQAGQEFFRARPTYASIYYAKRETGGGAIQDALTHLLDLNQFLIGPPTRFCAMAAHRGLDNVDVEDTVHAFGWHGDVPVSYALNQYQAPSEVTFTIAGSLATARLFVPQNRWELMKKGSDVWEKRFDQPTERDTAYIAQAQSFLSAIEGEGKVSCSLEEGIVSLRATQAVLTSAVENSRWVTV